MKKTQLRKNSKTQRSVRNDKKKRLRKLSRAQKNHDVRERIGMDSCTQS